MLELPEARTIARQLKEIVTGRTIVSAVAAASPKKTCSATPADTAPL